jgi:hypothetical protein
VEATVKKCLVAAMLAAVIVATPSAQPISESTAVADFNVAISDYVAMHRRLERLVGPRSSAQQGDLFTPALAREPDILPEVLPGMTIRNEVPEGVLR